MGDEGADRFVVVDAGQLLWRVGFAGEDEWYDGDRWSGTVLTAWHLPAARRRGHFWAELRKFLGRTPHSTRVALFTVGVLEGPRGALVSEIADACFGLSGEPALFESLLLVPQEYCAITASRSISRGAIAVALSVNLGSELSIYGFSDGYCVREAVRRFPNPLAARTCHAADAMRGCRAAELPWGQTPDSAAGLSQMEVTEPFKGMGYTELKRLLLTSEDVHVAEAAKAAMSKDRLLGLVREHAPQQLLGARYPKAYSARAFLEESGLAERVIDVLLTAPIDLRRDFAANIYLSGGYADGLAGELELAIQSSPRMTPWTRGESVPHGRRTASSGPLEVRVASVSWGGESPGSQAWVGGGLIMCGHISSLESSGRSTLVPALTKERWEAVRLGAPLRPAVSEAEDEECDRWVNVLVPPNLEPFSGQDEHGQGPPSSPPPSLDVVHAVGPAGRVVQERELLEAERCVERATQLPLAQDGGDAPDCGGGDGNGGGSRSVQAQVQARLRSMGETVYFERDRLWRQRMIQVAAAGNDTCACMDGLSNGSLHQAYESAVRACGEATPAVTSLLAADLSSLTVADLSGGKFTRLPDWLLSAAAEGRLANLRELNLEGCDQLVELPDLSSLGEQLTVSSLPARLRGWEEGGRKAWPKRGS